MFTIKKGEDDYHIEAIGNAISLTSMELNFNYGEPLQVELKGIVAGNIDILEKEAYLYDSETEKIIGQTKASIKVDCDSYKRNKNIISLNRAPFPLGNQYPMWDMVQVDFEGKENYKIVGVYGKYDSSGSNIWFLRIDVIPKKEDAKEEISKEHKIETLNDGSILITCSVCGDRYIGPLTKVMCKHLENANKGFLDRLIEECEK